MKEVGVLEAKTHLSALIDEALNGEDIVITRHGKPVVKLVPSDATRRPARDIAEQVVAVRDEIARACGVDPAFDWKAAAEEGRR